uniref:APS kinase domain-containing protein n=1 Tax=Manihot esculenta TaxID=3983 RepID=A0A2C9UX49_MANES
MLCNGSSTHIMWHKSSVDKFDREELLQQKGCVIWITGLSGSGKSTLACALSLGLHSRGKLTYILDGDNVRHGLNRDLGFKAEDRAENSRRIAMLFADAGVICTASLISPYRKDRDGCRALLPPGDFIEEFNFTEFIPGERCMKFASDRYSWMCHSNCVRQGTQRVFTDLLELERSKIVLKQKEDNCVTSCNMAETVISYLEERGYLRA